MQPATTNIPSPMAPQTQYQQYAPQQPPHHWMSQQPQYQVAPPQQPPASGYYYQQPPQQAMSVDATAQQYAAAPIGDDGIRSLWIGDLQYWMDEQYLLNCFAATGEKKMKCILCNKGDLMGSCYTKAVTMWYRTCFLLEGWSQILEMSFRTLR